MRLKNRGDFIGNLHLLLLIEMNIGDGRVCAILVRIADGARYSRCGQAREIYKGGGVHTN